MTNYSKEPILSEVNVSSSVFCSITLIEITRSNVSQRHSQLDWESQKQQQIATVFYKNFAMTNYSKEPILSEVKMSVQVFFVPLHSLKSLKVTYPNVILSLTGNLMNNNRLPQFFTKTLQ